MSVGVEQARILLPHWGLPADADVVELPGGTNSGVFRVTSAGRTWVLRVILNHQHVARLRLESAIVHGLQGRGLPFVVPAPEPTTVGTFYLHRGPVLANLWPAVPGEHPETVSRAAAGNAGRALGRLTLAMSSLDVADSLAAPLIPPYGALDQAHVLVPDPVAAVSGLAVDSGLRDVVLSVVRRLLAEAPAWYGCLPKQLIHSDFNRQNVLMIDDEVSGVLDFEFSTRDLRVMDLAVALSAWAGPHVETWTDWDLLDAFGFGYGAVVRLSEPEIAALPVLVQLRFVAVLLHFIGRCRQGVGGPEDVQRWVRYTVGIARWMARHEDELVRRAALWSG